MSLKLEQLALAISAHEGWITPGTPGFPDGSRSYRNNNPGNLRSSPFQVAVVGGFSMFKTDFDGWYALLYDLKCKATGKTSTGLNGNSTIKDLIYKWAPALDGNRPDKYVQAVCANTGFSPQMKLNELVI